MLFIFSVYVDTDMNLFVSKYEKKIMTVEYYIYGITLLTLYGFNCVVFDTKDNINQFLTSYSKNRLFLHPFRSNALIGTDAYTSPLILLLSHSFFDTNTYN